MNYFEKKDLWNEAQGAYLLKHPEDVDAIRTLSEDYTFIQNDCVFLCKAPEVVAKFNLKTKQFEELSELEELMALTRHNLRINPGHGPVNVKVIDADELEK